MFISATDECYFSGNNFIRVNTNKTEENMKVYLAGYFGYSAISFSTSSDLKDILYTIILWDIYESEIISNIGFIKSNNFTFIENFNTTKSEALESGRILFRSAYLTIPREYLRNEHFMIFRNNYKNIPEMREGKWVITAPPLETSVKSFNNKDICRKFSCDLQYRYRLIPLSIVLLVFAVFLIFLTVLARNMQPMKSRGISLLIGLIYNTMGEIVELIPFIIPGYNVEEAHVYNIYLHALLRIPIDFTIRNIILIVRNLKDLPREYSSIGHVNGCAEEL
jgi:hypothetical protein